MLQSQRYGRNTRKCGTFLFAQVSVQPAINVWWLLAEELWILHFHQIFCKNNTQLHFLLPLTIMHLYHCLQIILPLLCMPRFGFQTYFCKFGNSLQQIHTTFNAVRTHELQQCLIISSQLLSVISFTVYILFSQFNTLANLTVISNTTTTITTFI